MRGQRLRRCLQIPPLAAFHNIRTRIPGKSFRNHKGLTVIIARRSPFKSLYLAVVRVEWGKLVEKLNERRNKWGGGGGGGEERKRTEGWLKCRNI